MLFERHSHKTVQSRLEDKSRPGVMTAYLCLQYVSLPLTVVTFTWVWRLRVHLECFQLSLGDFKRPYILFRRVRARAAVDYRWHRIYHRVNLFCCSLYLHTAAADLSSLYNGFISHCRPRTCPKDMFVSNAMNSCWDDEEWVMKMSSDFQWPRAWEEHVGPLWPYFTVAALVRRSDAVGTHGFTTNVSCVQYIISLAS